MTIIMMIGRTNDGEEELPVLAVGVGVGTDPVGGEIVAIGIPALVQFKGVPL